MIIITGPTASGKSALAIEIASKKNGYIINMDCMQIYKSIPIITAQPSLDDFQQAPHHLYGFAENGENLSFGKWVKMVKETISLPQNKGKTPILVGGTMMYAYMLLTGYSDIPEIPDFVRQHATTLYEEIGHDEFLAITKKLDENTPQDRQRLIYNYCLITHTGNNFKHYHTLPKIHFFEEKPEIVIPKKTRQEVYATCNSRFLDMINDGLFEEINAVKHDASLPIKRATGFKYIIDFLNGKMKKEDVVEKSTQETRNYAKRQIIWLRKMRNEGIVANSVIIE